MNCKWVSNGRRDLKCARHADSSGYCIFHKENKTKREIDLFNEYIQKEKISDITGLNMKS